MDAFLPVNVASHPYSFAGPLLAGALFQAVEVGILISQSIRFWSNAAEEDRWIITTALLATLLAL